MMKVEISDWKDDNSERDVKVEVNDHDTFDLCSTLAYIILPSLKKFKEEEIGKPTGFTEDGEWEACLDAMIWSFDQVLTESEEPQASDYEFDIVSNEETRKLFLSDHNTYNHKVQNGLDLFAKHYRSLWY